MTEHYFGGAWTEIKLDILEKYLNFFTTALKNQSFDLVYIDAFAGTGERYQIIPEAPLLDEKEQKLILDGSAIKALSTKVPFDIYYFIEKNKKRLTRLKEIAENYPDRNICFSPKDANEEIINICQTLNWRKYRAVMFLDPYGLDVDWDTLQAIQRTKAIDVWYLFSLSGFYRQAATKLASMEKYKIEKINKLLGTEDWINYIYSNNQSKDQMEMFSKGEIIIIKNITVDGFESYIKSRLKSLFPYVSKPLALPNTGAQLYSLFFCVSNPNANAIKLAKKPSNYILKMYE